MRCVLGIAARSWTRSIRIVVVAMLLACGIGLSAQNANAEESVGQIAPIHLILPPTNMALGPILDVNLLPDGRVATIGYVSDSRDTYVRIFDPRTGADEIFDEPVEGGLQPVEGMGRSIAIAGDSVFVYGIKARLLRAILQPTGSASSVTQPDEAPRHLIRLQGYDLSGMQRISGAMASYGESVLIGWWEGAYARLRAGDCGEGAIVRRVAADGREIWRWQDLQEGFGTLRDIIALADGTILVRVSRGINQAQASGGCLESSGEIVALAADGHEIDRLDLSPFLCVGPLSLGAGGRDAVAIAQTDDAPYAILRVGMEEGRIRLDRLDLPEKIPNVGCRETVATIMVQGGYRIVGASYGLLALDEAGHPLESRPFPANREMTCYAHGDQGVVCWKDSEIAILPLTAAAPPPSVAWPLQAMATTDHAKGSSVVQHVERLPDGRLAVMSQADRSEFASFQILESNGSIAFSSVLGAGSVNWPNHAAVTVKDAVFVSKQYGGLWRLSGNQQQDMKLEPLGGNRTVWWNGILSAGDDVDVMGWEDSEEPGSCGKGARVAHLSPDGKPAWIWLDTRPGIRFPTDMISLGSGSALVLLDGQPPLDLIDLIGEETSYCYERGRTHLVLIGPDGKELDRMILPEGLELGSFSRHGDGGAAALALQKGFDPDLIVTIQIQNDRIVMSRIPVQTPLPISKDTAIVTGTSDGYRLLLRSHILTLDHDGRLIAKQRRAGVTNHCEMVANQGDFCWTVDQILFQPLQ